jgi:signal transduction histidine kinase
MRRPWHYWAAFAIGLALVLPAMIWLTVKAMELDQANAIARKHADLEQDIGRALWRMDARLTPLLASEAARPDFVYRTRYATIRDDQPEGKFSEVSRPGDGKPQVVQTLSPLVAEPPDYVLLHFEVLPDGQVISPQSPPGEEAAWAIENGASLQTLATAAPRLAELQQVLTNLPLVDQLPVETLPPAGYALASNTNTVIVQNNPPIYNKFAQPRGSNYGGSNRGNYSQASGYENNQPNGPPSSVQSEDAAQSPALAGQQASPSLPPEPASQQTSDFPNEPLPFQQQEEGQQLALVPGNFDSPLRSPRLPRTANDLENRDAALQAYAQKAVSEQRQSQKLVIEATPAVEGVSQPLWVDGRLILARRVQVGNQVRVQGCWLDWDRLQQMLKAEVADLLPEVELTPVTSEAPVKLGRLLATLPVQVSVPMPDVQPEIFSPIRVSLLAAWGCLVLVSIAAAITLQSVVTLSERRASFVSAVTHELRTPLTTFRMYAEMLASGMVPEEMQKQQYLNTLRIEADRLAHLVDNVLQYARLERTNPNRNRQQVAVQDLFDRLQDRLVDRTRQAEMDLVVDIQSCANQVLVTDPQAVEQILFNLVDNACKYAAHTAKKQIDLNVGCRGQQITICVRDYGPGISAVGRRKLFRPFSKSVHDAAHSAPGVGLGLALCERLARDLGGRLQYQPANPGCTFMLQLPL